MFAINYPWIKYLGSAMMGSHTRRRLQYRVGVYSIGARRRRESRCQLEHIKYIYIIFIYVIFIWPD